MWSLCITRTSFSLIRILPCFAAFFCACEKRDILPDDKPRIMEMEVVGFDKKNVSIDQVKNIITIELPEGMNHSLLYTKVKLTKGAELVPRTYGTRIDLISGSQEDKFFMVTREDAGMMPDTVKYTFQFIQNAPLGIELADEHKENQYQIARGESLYIKVENFLDGSPGEIRLEHQLDPAAPAITLAGCDFGFGEHSQSGTLDGQLELVIPLTTPIVPGPYAVSFRKRNGRMATASRPLVLTKGPIRLSWSGYLPQRSINGAPVTITGYNLYESSNLAIVLIDTEGKKHQTKITKYDPFGQSLTFDPGRNIKPGYYTLQIFTNGKLASYYDGTWAFQNYRFAVTKTSHQPFIMIFEGSNDKNQEYADVYEYREKPVTFKKEVETGDLHWGFANLTTSMLWFDVELESITQPGYVKRTDIWIRNLSTYQEGAECMLGDAFYPNYPPGKYRMRVVVTNRETHEEYKSEPFERVVEIK